MDLTEREWIASVALDGDERAYEELVRMHQSAIRGFLLRLTRGDGALADDLAQETFLKAYLKIGTYKGTGRFFSWLARIAYTNFLQELRKRRPDFETGANDQKVEGEEPSFEGGSSARMDLEQAMRILSIEERAAITMCYAYGMSHSEASRASGMPVGTVKSHIARGKDKLRAELCAWQEEIAV